MPPDSGPRRSLGRGLALAGALLAALVAASAGCRERPAPPTGLTVLLGRDVEGLDPHTSGLVLQTQTVLANAYDGLVDFDRAMTLRPGLAASWTNPDDLTWIFELRPHVPFHTGGEVTAADVVYSIERARDLPDSVLGATLATVSEVSAQGVDRVRIRTSRVDVHLLAQMRRVYVVSKAFAEAHRGQPLGVPSCGTGAYRVVAREPNRFIDLLAFDPTWHREKPTIRAVRMLASCDLSGEAGAWVLKPPRLVFRADAGGTCSAPPATELHTAPGLAVWYLGFDLDDHDPKGVRLRAGDHGNPFRDPDVRAAISAAIDRTGMDRAAFGGYAYSASQLVPRFVTGYDASVSTPVRQLEKAKALMRRSAYPEGFAVRLDLREMAAGLRDSLTRDLSEIGIRVESVTLADADFFRRLESGDSAMFVLRFFCWTGDAQDLLDQVLHSPSRALGLGAFNYSSDTEMLPGLDAAIEEARMEREAGARIGRLQAILHRVAESALLVPLAQPTDVVAASPGLDLAPRADGFLLAREVRIER